MRINVKIERIGYLLFTRKCKSYNKIVAHMGTLNSVKRKLLFHDHAVCLKTFPTFSTIIVQRASQTRVTGNQASANGRGDSLWSDFE